MLSQPSLACFTVTYQRGKCAISVFSGTVRSIRQSLVYSHITDYAKKAYSLFRIDVGGLLIIICCFIWLKVYINILIVPCLSLSANSWFNFKRKNLK